jgi:hypothetical protein
MYYTDKKLQFPVRVEKLIRSLPAPFNRRLAESKAKFA